MMRIRIKIAVPTRSALTFHMMSKLIPNMKGNNIKKASRAKLIKRRNRSCNKKLTLSRLKKKK